MISGWIELSFTLTSVSRVRDLYELDELVFVNDGVCRRLHAERQLELL